METVTKNQEKNLKKASGEQHSHSGHRERLRAKILKEGFDHLYDHELLEFLLYYGIPRRDTNQTAHELIERFGTLNGLMEADTEDISERPGMGVGSALLIKAVMEMATRYYAGKQDRIYYYDTLRKIVTYLQTLYFGEIREASYALLFDNRMKLLDAVKIGDGSVNASPVNLRLLMEAIVKKHAAAFVLAHNHPDGIVTPSFDDYNVTRQIYDLFRQFSVPLLEHIIISGREYYPIMHYSGQYDVEQLCEDTFGEPFFHKFFEPITEPPKLPSLDG